MSTPDDDSRAPRDQHDDEPERQEPAGQAPSEKLGIFQIAFSTVAAAFGVQSSRNRARDFNSGKPTHFIIAGVLFTAGFVVVMVLLVSLVLRNVGS